MEASANSRSIACTQIGSVPTPWPSWLIAAHPERAPADALRPFLSTLTGYVREFNSQERRAGPNVEFIKDKFGYPEEDIEARSHHSHVLPGS